jgi:uncharacterized membrane protein
VTGGFIIPFIGILFSRLFQVILGNEDGWSIFKIFHSAELTFVGVVLLFTALGALSKKRDDNPKYSITLAGLVIYGFISVLMYSIYSAIDVYSVIDYIIYSAINIVYLIMALLIGSAPLISKGEM